MALPFSHVHVIDKPNLIMKQRGGEEEQIKSDKSQNVKGSECGRAAKTY